MKLNHLNLTVTDAAETAQFLEKHFGLRGMEGVEPKKTFAMLGDDNGLVLTLIRADRTSLGSLASGKSWNKPQTGFLNLDKRLVKALTDSTEPASYQPAEGVMEPPGAGFDAVVSRYCVVKVAV